MSNRIFNNVGNNVCGRMLCDVVDDLATSVSGFSKPNAELMEQIRKEEEERINEEKKNAAKNQLAEDQMRQKYEALTLRKERARNDAFLKRLKARTEENNKYLAGNLDTEEHRENLSKLDDEYDNEINKIDKEFRKQFENLRLSNPAMYRKVTW